ncbi:acyl-CoA dehydrogenase [Granulosicoccus antarcticus]|uniref:Acyl-coenzyme A dehydrogenase n=1 Tax=Granulosicoccus antarcticus IMCC3135 TaxID=1192854 RepID=A0A2Z2NT71_9GAMM|nr:acyl-CoA dehydrogenase [Granulosicoccus antarcticus]ASJ74752.1 Acyl-coenzyme A dehydrogenase [Granulosicoccus antarcticus IMCC3135]
MGIIFWLAVLALTLFVLSRHRLSLPVASVATVLVLLLASWLGFLSGVAGTILVLLLVAVGVLFNVRSLRHRFFSFPILKYVRAVLPPMSETERAAIDAGTVWWEAELFRGSPNWSTLQSYPEATLSPAEQAFVDGPVNELCAMMDDWQITHELNDLPPEVWQFIKDQRFLGMVIPESYGGLGFSAMAHSEVVTKLATRSVTGAVTVMVPNSLGPAELLLHYGTETQKDYYLPRLAIGQEIPCFALTGPSAGSDAGAMPDFGIICMGQHEGAEVLGMRVTWEKRYITLGPVATLLGLAFKAYDPDHLLGDEENLGITCALIPTDTAGVKIGRRHYPLDQSFMNGPNSGDEVFIPMDWIIGGQPMVGQGWRMLMESLSVGRGISLPSNGVASGKATSRYVGAYARVRKQFNLPIGKFEGIEEALGRIAGLTYTMDAGRRLTCSALDQGEKPSVVSAILKYYNTEGMRVVLNDGMDIIGGKGICMGPGNFLGRAYQAIPVGITVEGANILTRSLIIFGQGAIRCHPWLMDEITAASLPNQQEALESFDEALMGHVGYAIQNGARSLFHGLTKGYFASAPDVGYNAKYYRRLARMSAAYSFLADFAMLFLGGGLKRKEMLSGRFADGLMHMYMASAVLKRFEDTGRPEDDRPLLEWSVRHSLFQVQVALDQILRNFPNTFIGLVLRGIVFPLGRRYRTPNDALTQACARILLDDSPARDRLTEGVFVSDDPKDVTGCIEHALKRVLAATDAEHKLKESLRLKPYAVDYADWLQQLVQEKVIESAEADLLLQAAEAIEVVVRVDDFPGVAG